MRIALHHLLVSACTLALTACATGDQGSPPHLDRVEVVPAPLQPSRFIPSFYFTDPDGDADEVHRTVIAIEGHLPNFNPSSHIFIAPDVQRRGAVWAGAWACDPEQISTTVRAYISDRRGNRSNAVDYTVRCR